MQQDTAPPAYAPMDQQLLAGRWRHGRAGSERVDLNPYTEQPILAIPQASREDLDETYLAAVRAQREWAQTLPEARAEVMRRAARVMEARHEEIVSWLIRESGSTRLKAELEWQAVHAGMLEASALPHMVEGAILPADVPGKESRAYRKPVGVVGIISPWNWPLQLTNRSLAPALAVGNAAVVKPASDTPVTGGLLLARIFEEAALPPGVLSVIIGGGSEIGDAFVTHAVPRVISFTGSTPVGRHLLGLAAKASVIKRMELELGGNSPCVILDDADLDQAVEAAVFGKFLHQGQICMITNRFIVDERVYDEFVQRFGARAASLQCGDPNDPDTIIGPVINRKQLDSLQDKIDRAREAGLRQVTGGEPDGLVLPPHVFADVDNESPVAREEQFGPIAPVIRARGEAEALAIANATEQGLSSAVFTGDVERGVRFAQQVEAGMTHVNDQPVNDLPFSPFGGEKNSGIGRFNGRWAINAFTTDHWITVQHSPRSYPLSAKVATGPQAGG